MAGDVHDAGGGGAGEAGGGDAANYTEVRGLALGVVGTVRVRTPADLVKLKPDSTSITVTGV
jgi:hypothetical protein